MLNRTITVVSAIIMVIGITLFLLLHISGTGWQALSIKTGSMRPKMPPGSLVLVHSVPISNYKIGDVITYTNPNNIHTTITHRIVKMYLIGGKIPGFVTKGDSNKFKDEPIAAGSLVGKVIWHHNYFGSWLMNSKSWATISLLVYLPALILMIEEVRRLKDYLKVCQPYKLYYRQQPKNYKNIIYYSKLSTLTLISVLIFSFIIWQPVLALIRGNTVKITNNIIGVATKTNQCSSNSNININNSSNQNSSTGSANTTNDTSGGSSTSGNATNSNSTNVNITVKNC